MIWLVIGSGPSAPEWLKRVGGWTHSITCNAGIKLCPNPDFYLAVDQIANREYRVQAEKAQASGTKLVTLAREPSAMKERGTTGYDIKITEDPRALPHVGGYGRFRYSGPLMLEVACNHGATELHLVGFDGYRKDSVAYFDESDRLWADEEYWLRNRRERLEMTHVVSEEAMGRVANAWSHCRFVVHGPSRFVVNSPNWMGADQWSSNIESPAPHSR